MARRTKVVTIDAEGRDRGKSFLITEMAPRKAEKWAARVLFAIAKGGGDDREAEEVAASGMAGLAAVGLRSLTRVDFPDAEPLLDEMLECVAFVPDKTRLDQTTGQPYFRAMIEDDVEEVSTLLALRSEVIEIHLGFSPAAFLSTLGAAAKAKLNSFDTPTSPNPSV